MANAKYQLEVREWEPAEVEELMRLPGYVVLAMEPGSNGWTGFVENSFSMGTSKERTQFHWTSDNATSNFGGRFRVDGKAAAEREAEGWRRKHPTWKVEVFDAREDEALPIVLDWEGWVRAKRRANTLAGVVDKYGSRNLKFEPK